MRTIRIFCEDISKPTAMLDPVQSRHISRVLRLGVGDAVQAFDGRGGLAEAVVEAVSHRQVTLRIERQERFCPKTSGRMIVAVSMAKGERFDWMIEKCTELGVDHLAAVQYDRTVKLGKGSAMERYRKIALESAKQCGRAHLPVLSGPAKLEQTVSDLRTRYPDAQLLVGDPSGKNVDAKTACGQTPDRIVFVGPEGGFSDAERHFFGDLKAEAVCVNPNILRIETAAVAFTAVFCCQRSDANIDANP